jgi:hypothetical protein
LRLALGGVRGLPKLEVDQYRDNSHEGQDAQHDAHDHAGVGRRRLALAVVKLVICVALLAAGGRGTGGAALGAGLADKSAAVVVAGHWMATEVDRVEYSVLGGVAGEAVPVGVTGKAVVGAGRAGGSWLPCRGWRDGAVGEADPVAADVVEGEAGCALGEREAGRAGGGAGSCPCGSAFEVASYGEAAEGDVVQGAVVAGVAGGAREIVDAGLAVEETGLTGKRGFVGVETHGAVHSDYAQAGGGEVVGGGAFDAERRVQAEGAVGRAGVAGGCRVVEVGAGGARAEAGAVGQQVEPSPAGGTDGQRRAGSALEGAGGGHNRLRGAHFEVPRYGYAPTRGCIEDPVVDSTVAAEAGAGGVAGEAVVGAAQAVLGGWVAVEARGAGAVAERIVPQEVVGLAAAAADHRGADGAQHWAGSCNHCAVLEVAGKGYAPP